MAYYMKVVNILILIICVLVSCTKNTSKDDIAEISSILIVKSLNQSGKLLKPYELNDIYFKTHNIPNKYQTKFIEFYEHLRADLNKLSLDYSELYSVRCFLLNKYLNHNRNKDTIKQDSLAFFYATDKNPYYVAFAILSENFVDLRKIGNDTYIRSLARSFNILPCYVYEGIWTCLLNNPKVIFEKIAHIVQSNLHDQNIDDPSFFFINILLPYYKYLSNGYIFNPSIEDSIFKQFGKVYKTSDAEKVMREYSCGFKGYLLGDPLKVKLQNDLNSLLATHHFRLYLGQRSCVGYKILSNCIPINCNQIGKVLFIKKVSISFSNAYIGLSTTNENDVVVSVDDIFDEAQEIQVDLNQNLPLTSCSSFNSIWMEQSMGFSISEADSILSKLLRKEFNKKSVESISEMIIKLTAIHEVKHKWDEKTSTQEHWYNVDCETSAYLTSCALSDISYFSLILAIMNFEDFYKNIQQIEIRNKILKLLRECWHLAKSASEDSVNEKQIANKALDYYNAYSMIAGGSLPSIKQFSETIMPIIDSIFSKNLNIEQELYESKPVEEKKHPL